MSAHNEQPLLKSEPESSGEKDCLLYNIERISYTQALALQHDIHARCAENTIPGMLILLEHDPVITMGVKSTSHGNVLFSPEYLRQHGVELVETDRGGDSTYHGPGQLVGYPIIRPRELGLDVHSYLRCLEQSVIDTLAEYGLEGHRNGLAGVWVGDLKVCSIGIAVRKWVTYHGFALNVDPNMQHFFPNQPLRPRIGADYFTRKAAGRSPRHGRGSRGLFPLLFTRFWR